MKNTLVNIILGAFLALFEPAHAQVLNQGEMNEISSTYKSLFKNSHESENPLASTARSKVREIDAEIDNGLKISTLFVDDTSTPQIPDRANTTVYMKRNGLWVPREIYNDSDLDGIRAPDYKKINTFDPKFTLQDDYLIGEGTDFPVSVFSHDNLDSSIVSNINPNLECTLKQLLAYHLNPAGEALKK